MMYHGDIWVGYVTFDDAAGLLPGMETGCEYRVWRNDGRETVGYFEWDQKTRLPANRAPAGYRSTGKWYYLDEHPRDAAGNLIGARYRRPSAKQGLQYDYGGNAVVTPSRDFDKLESPRIVAEGEVVLDAWNHTWTVEGGTWVPLTWHDAIWQCFPSAKLVMAEGVLPGMSGALKPVRTTFDPFAKYDSRYDYYEGVTRPEHDERRKAGFVSWGNCDRPATALLKDGELVGVLVHIGNQNNYLEKLVEATPVVKRAWEREGAKLAASNG